MKHTKGPWSFTKDCRIFKFNEPYAIFNSENHDEAIAVTTNKVDAQLIAVAPELLDALVTIVETIKDGTLKATLNNDVCLELFEKDLKSLINKAKGE